MYKQILDKGSVKLLSLTGSDAEVASSARISYNQTSNDSERDTKLIRYLIKNRHTSPLEHCSIKIHVKAPLFVVAQWVRHRTWSFNFISYRYTEAKDEFYIPEQWRGQSKSNKQMSSGEVETPEGYEALITSCHQWYEDAVKKGVAREMARMVLPQSLYTEFVATVDLHNLLHFIELRDHPHSQHEIKEYARFLSEIVEHYFPKTFSAFENYKLHSKTFSLAQLQHIKRSLKTGDHSSFREDQELSKLDKEQLEELFN